MNGIIQLKDFAMENNKLLISLVEICCFFQTRGVKIDEPMLFLIMCSQCIVKNIFSCNVHQNC